MVDVSVIMPVYNSEAYISETIESVLRQSHKNFELILVDDGSSDGCGEICDAYSKKDARVKVIHKCNEGICATRNKGLDMACGRYVAFCDNDDLYLDDLIKDNLRLADYYNADVVRFARVVTSMDDGQVIGQKSTSGFANIYVSPEEMADKFYQIDNTGEGVWAGIYRREFLEQNNIRFDCNMRYGFEDFDFLMRIYMRHPSIVLNSKSYYNWVLRKQHSTSAKTDWNNIQALMTCLIEKKQLIDDLGGVANSRYSWAGELSRRICYVVKYVSGKKVRMPFRKRIQMIRDFGQCQVFEGGTRRRILRDSWRERGPATFLVNFLFLYRGYVLLYLLVSRRNMHGVT